MAITPGIPVHPYIVPLSTAHSQTFNRVFVDRYKRVAPSAAHVRKLPFEAAKALELLAHAIEYLSDEFALACLSGDIGSDSSSNQNHPNIAAIEILKRLNREIYLSYPLVPTLGQRLRSFLGQTWKSHG